MTINNRPAQTQDQQLLPIVEIKDDQVIANSRAVAEVFGKRHDNVLRDIDHIIDTEELGSSILRDQLYDHYTLIKFYDEKARKEVRSYDMTKDGFTLLVMGYGGAKAMQFKWAYIQQFNAMEAELKKRVAPALPDFTNPAEAARAWAGEYEGRMVAEQKVLEAQPKVQTYDKFHDAEGLSTISEVASTLGMSAIALNRKLDAIGVWDNRSKKRKPVQVMLDKGYFTSKNFTNVKTGYSGAGHKVTPKGVHWMQEMFGMVEAQ